MNAFFEALGAYQFLNNILPGAVFIWTAKLFLGLEFPIEGLGEAIIAYYIVGFFISRIGSLVIAPVLQRFRFLASVKYVDFVSAEQKDAKVQTLSSINNCYRSLLSCFLLLPVTAGCKRLVELSPWLASNFKSISLFLLILLMLVSYRKQNQYVCDRVTAVNKSNN